MTLEFLLNELCTLAIKHNLVNYAAAGGSIYALNADTIKDYPYFFFSPTDDIRIEKNFTTYGLTVFYVDRLLADNSNDTQIYSTATLAITNLLRQAKAFEGIVEIGDYNIRVFSETEKMADKVNGAYARVNITTLNSFNCAVYYDETGAPLGTYIPDVIKDENVLDNLASKPWVIQYVASHSEGTDEKTVQKMINKSLKDYTKTSDFATINGSGITSGETYDLLERDAFNEFLSGYSTDMQEIRQEISAATPADYDELRTQVSANTEDIRTLSGATESLSGTVSGLSSGLDTLSGTVGTNVENISNLSAFTSGLSFTVSEHTEKIEQLSGATSALTQDLSNLSAYTETLGSNLGDLSAATSGISSEIFALSGFTAQAVSSITSDVDALSASTATLSGATSAALSGLSGDVAELSGVTGVLEAQISAIASAETAAVFDLREYGVYNGVLMDVYNDMVSAYTANKTIFLVTAVKVTNSSNGRTCPTIAPATVRFDEQNRPLFKFELMSHLTGAPAGIYTSNAVNFTATGATGLFEYSWLNDRYYIADSSLGRYMAYAASKFDTGCVRLSSGMTQDVYGEASVALGSGLTYGSNLEVQANIGSGLTFDANGAITTTNNGNVESQSVNHIWSGNLAAYQALGTYSNDTLYLII